MLLLYAVIPSLAMVYTAICGLVLLGAMPRSQIIYHLGSILPTTFIWPSFRIGPGHTRFALSLSFALILALILLFSGVTAGTFGEKFYFFSAHNGTSGIRILLDSGATRSVFHTGCDLALITNVVRLKYPINVMGVNGTMPIQNLGTVTLHFLDDNSRMQTLIIERAFIRTDTTNAECLLSQKNTGRRNFGRGYCPYQVQVKS